MANIKLSKTQLHKIGQSGGFLCRLLVPLVQAGLPLLGNIPKPLAKSVLIPLGLMAAASATDAAIHKKLFGSGFTTLIISNEEMEDIMRIVEPLEDSGLLIKGVSERIKKKAKKQKGGLMVWRAYGGMLLGRLGTGLLGNLLTGKVTFRGGEVTIRTGENFRFQPIL